MEAGTLIKKEQARVVDLGTKYIIKYTSPDQVLEVNHMKITGRHPEDPNHFVYEEDVHFMMYVIKGNGKVYLGEKVVDVCVGDVVDIPAKAPFAVEGTDFEYLALQTPAWKPGQAFIVDSGGSIVENTQK